MDHAARLQRLRKILEAEKADCLLVGALANLRYLTGFSGSAGLLLVDEESATFYTDGRYTLAAAEEVKGARVVVPRRGPLEGALARLRRRRYKRVGFEAGSGYSFYRRLASELGARRLRPVEGAVERLRRVKDEEEIGAIRASVELTARVLDEVLPMVRPGVAERDLAAELEYRMRRHGAEKPAFDTIVASGPRSALPHARPSARRLGKNELVLFDLGAILGGYSSDMTRTVCLGSAKGVSRRMYRTVQEAQEQACRAVRAGVSCAQVDRAARRHIALRGYGKFFPHTTGHGLGIQVHEEPKLSSRERSRLLPGNVVTVEPGIYVPGVGGVRIEDVVVVRENGAEVLTPAPRDFLALGD